MLVEHISELNRHQIVFYDGECGFCNRIVQLVLKHSKDNRIKFCPLQAEIALSFMQSKGIQTIDYSTFYFWNGSTLSSKSRAFFLLSKELKAPISVLHYGKILPLFLTDGVYNWVANNRKKFEKDFCLVLSADQRERFIQL